MVARLRHRGPDGGGACADGSVALGHARLSIIDIEGGAQPMRAPECGLTITFNGEIFNYLELRRELSARGHRFRTRSDTEVILHAYDEWGDGCVHHLNGQWAFAIWDERRARLFLSRDRVGVRPLFYTTADDSFLFASEVKALFTNPAVRRALDPVALAQIFTFWSPVPPRTAFAGIAQLPPGHSMVVQDGRIAVHQYWDMAFTPAAAGVADVRDYAHELWSLLLDATRLRLRSDVPVGVYLSGGLDSSAVAALARQCTGADIHSFSVAFDDEEFDESPFQGEVSRHLGTIPHTVRCTSGDIAGLLPDVIWHAETPILRTGPAPLFMLSGTARQQGFKVVLTGEGADEVLGGYDIFKEAKVRAFWARRPESARRALLLRRLYPYLPALQRQPHSGLRAFFHASPDDVRQPFFSHAPRWSLTSGLHRLFSSEMRHELGEYDPLADMRRTLPEAFAGWTPLARAQYLEARGLLPGYILSSQGDRVAMAHSVEIRMPFLDHRVIEFAGRLPDPLKMRVLNEKYLLKTCMEGHLPASVLARPKQPYRAPDGKTLLAPGDGPVHHALSARTAAEHGVFDPHAVEALMARIQAGASGARDGMGLVGVLSTHLLIDRFVRETTTTPTSEADADRTRGAAVHC